MSRRRRVRVAAAVALAFLLIPLLAVGTGVAKAYRIPAAGMEPTLRCGRSAPGCSGSTGDRVAVLKYLFGGPSRGDVIAFRSPPGAEVACGEGGIRVKRVIGLPGERWEERAGRVFIGRTRLREPYVKADRRDARTIAPRRVPGDGYVVLGDNRAASCDSRDWGSLPRENVIGRVVAIWWPPGRISFP